MAATWIAPAASEIVRHLRTLERLPPRRLLLAGAAIGAASLLLRLAAFPAIGHNLSLLTLYPGVFAAGMLCGFEASAACLAVMAPLTVYWFMYGAAAPDAQCAVSTVIALGAAVLVGYAGAAHRADRLARAQAHERAETSRAALERSEERYRLAVEHSPEAITVEHDGKIVLANQAAADLFAAASTAEIVGRPFLDFVHAEAQERARARLDRALRADRPIPPKEQPMLRADATAFDGEAWAAPVPWDGGQAVQVIVRDISDRKRLERELARSNTDLEDFAQIVSHDLKEPLRGIADYAGILLEECSPSLNEGSRDRLETVVRLAARMNELVESLMNYARVGRERISLRQVATDDVVGEAAESLRTLVERAGGELIVHVPMPGARCDPVLVRQVFANLISNGLKYNLSAHKRVEVGCRADAMPPAYFVRDNGIGIAPRHHAAVFQMFRRLHPRDRFGGGTGSGLAIVKKIIQRHGGTIWIESELGQGATVCFTLEPPSSADSTQVEYPSVVVTQAGRVPPSPAADPAPPPAI